MKTYSWIGIVAVVIIGVVLLTRGQHSSTGVPSSVQTVSPMEFQTKLQSTPTAVLVDVRTPEEYNSGHIPGAINIDIESDDFLSKVQALDPTVPYFVYCRSGNRSSMAVAMMRKVGIQDITELRGGLLAAPELVR